MKSRDVATVKKLFSEKSSGRRLNTRLNQTISSKTFLPSRSEKSFGIGDFISVVVRYYKKHGRHDLPWRSAKKGEHNPYHVLVSEMMLQQTQVARVIPKYTAFLSRFPTVAALAQAELGEVYALWQGLGYNRRARFLRDAARAVCGADKKASHNFFPNTIEQLESLPGVGPYTARAVYTFAYNKPCVLIETNVRACVLHHFFPIAKKKEVSDARIEEIVEACLLEVMRRKIDPRSWYSALMDYGTHIKVTYGNPNTRSTTHVVQKKFKGSVREARGAIMARLSAQKRAPYGIPYRHLYTELHHIHPVQLDTALEGLVRDSLVYRTPKKSGDVVRLAR